MLEITDLALGKVHFSGLIIPESLHIGNLARKQRVRKWQEEQIFKRKPDTNGGFSYI